MREIMNFDLGWKFFRGNLAPVTNTDGWGGGKGKSFYFGATAMDLDDSGWRDVTVPHDFVLEGDFTRKRETFVGGDRVPDMETIDSRHLAGGSLEGGIGWYRRKFDIPGEWEGKRFRLVFDGVFRNSSVYLNEHFVGSHESGYTGFSYDVSDYINFDRPNVLAVRVDASGREGWWYEGGGIYRHVRMEVAEPVHVEQDGIYVTAQPDLEAACAEIHIRTEVANRLDRAVPVTVTSEILDAEGRLLAAASGETDVDYWDRSALEQQLHLDRVFLWELNRPYLYTLRTKVSVEGRPVDEKLTCFGVRSITIDPDRGLVLNGKPVKIKGVCQHLDHAGTGIALPDRLLEYRLKKIKELGANACRCSHNPPNPEFLDLCDRMGILVMDETRKTSSSGENLSQLRAMVRRDRNHPCIYCWSIGNEEVNLQFQPEAAKVIHTMRMEVRKLDPSRPVTMALVYWNPNARGDTRDIAVEALKPLAEELDVAGFNYSPDKWDTCHEAVPGKPMMNTEAYSNGWTRSVYETDTDRGFFYVMDPENGHKNIRKWSGDSCYKAERMWKMYAERPYLAGYFVWTAFDYRGEPTPMPYPAISTQFGMMDYCGFRKDISYFYQSWWVDEPVLHLFPHWNDLGKERVTVYCYSNLDEVELFVNGKSYGRKQMQRNWFLQWDGVAYEPGTLLAVAWKDGREALRREVCTTGAPCRLELIPYTDEIRADGQDVGIAEVRVLDAEGRIVPTADVQIRFTVDGAGTFLGAGNGNPGSHESDSAPVRRAFGGLCQVLARAGREAGQLRIRAAADGLRGAECIISVVRAERSF